MDSIYCASCLGESEVRKAVALVSSRVYVGHEDDNPEVFYPVCREFLDQMLIDNRSVIMLPQSQVFLVTEDSRNDYVHHLYERIDRLEAKHDQAEERKD